MVIRESGSKELFEKLGKSLIFYRIGVYIVGLAYILFNIYVFCRFNGRERF